MSAVNLQFPAAVTDAVNFHCVVLRFRKRGVENSSLKGKSLRQCFLPHNVLVNYFGFLITSTKF